MPADPAIFNPTAAQAAAVLADFDSPDLSFRELAQKHGTNSHALAVWLSSSDARAQIEHDLDLIALRTRLVASSLLTSAAGALQIVVDNYLRDYGADIIEPSNRRPHAAPVPPTPEPLTPDDLTRMEHRRRRDDTARRAIYLVYRLANFFPPTRPPSPRTPRRAAEPDRNGDGRLPTADPQPATTANGTPNPGSAATGLVPIPGFLHPTTTALAPVSQRHSEVGRRGDLSEPCPPATTCTAPSASDPISTFHFPISTFPSPPAPLTTPVGSPSTFSRPSLTLEDFVPALPPELRAPRGPALLLARAGIGIGVPP